MDDLDSIINSVRAEVQTAPAPMPTPALPTQRDPLDDVIDSVRQEVQPQQPPLPMGQNAAAFAGGYNLPNQAVPPSTVAAPPEPFAPPPLMAATNLQQPSGIPSVTQQQYQGQAQDAQQQAYQNWQRGQVANAAYARDPNAAFQQDLQGVQAQMPHPTMGQELKGVGAALVGRPLQRAGGFIKSFAGGAIGGLLDAPGHIVSMMRGQNAQGGGWVAPTGQAVRQAGTDIQEANPVQTPGGKILAGAGDVAGMIGTGVLAGPAAPLVFGAIGRGEQYNRATNAMDKQVQAGQMTPEDEQRTAANEATVGMFTGYLTAKIPGFGKVGDSFIRSLLKTAAMGGAQSVAEDLTAKGFHGDPKSAAQIVEDAAIASALGGFVHSVLHFVHMAPGDAKAAMSSAFPPDMQPIAASVVDRYRAGESFESIVRGLGLNRAQTATVRDYAKSMMTPEEWQRPNARTPEPQPNNPVQPAQEAAPVAAPATNAPASDQLPVPKQPAPERGGLGLVGQPPGPTAVGGFPGQTPVRRPTSITDPFGEANAPTPPRNLREPVDAAAGAPVQPSPQARPQESGQQIQGQAAQPVRQENQQPGAGSVSVEQRASLLKRPAPGPFTRAGLEKALFSNHEAAGHGYTADDESAINQAQVGGDAWLFHKELPGEVRRYIEGNPAAKRLFRVTQDSAVSGGEDAMATLGDRYWNIADKMTAKPKKAMLAEALNTARSSPDPQTQLMAAVYDNLPPAGQKKPRQSIIDPRNQPVGAEWQTNGHTLRIVEDADGYRLLKDGDDYPVLPVDGLSAVPVDKGTLSATEPPVPKGDIFPAEQSKPTFFSADEAGASKPGAGIFGQTTFDAATGSKQGSMSDTSKAAPVTEAIKGSANALNPKNTEEMFPASRGFEKMIQSAMDTGDERTIAKLVNRSVAGRKYFQQQTGIKLPVNVRDAMDAIDAWAKGRRETAAPSETLHYSGISLDEVRRLTGLSEDSPALHNVGLPRASDVQVGQTLSIPKGSPGANSGLTKEKGKIAKVIAVWRTAGPKERDQLLHLTLQADTGEQYGVGGKAAERYKADVAATGEGRTTPAGNSPQRPGKEPWQMTSKEFEQSYFQHIDLRSSGDEASKQTRESIQREGFRRGFNVNATRIVPADAKGFQARYRAGPGKDVYLIPQSAIVEDKNGPKVKEGWKPTDANIVRVKEGQSLHHAAVEQAIAQGKTVPHEVLAEYPDLDTTPPANRTAGDVQAEGGRSFRPAPTPEPAPTPVATPKQIKSDLYGPGSFVGDVVVPQVQGTAGGLKAFIDHIRKIAAPQTRGPTARNVALALREMMARRALATDRAVEYFKEASKFFDGMSKEASVEFWDKAERGESQGDPILNQYAKMIVDYEKGMGEQVREVAPGKLRQVITDKNYLGRIWKDPEKAKGILSTILGKRPLEGPKGFLKKRSIEWFSDGIKAGLEPITYNPVDMALLKGVEMTRFVEMHRTLNELKADGLRKYVGVNDTEPDGWETVDDAAFKVYGPPTITVEEAYDKGVREPLLRLAEQLGVKHVRKIALGGGKLGLSYTGQNLIESKFATPDQVIAHELGHQIGDKWNLIHRMTRADDPSIKTKTGQQKMRGKLAKQMRALADLRDEHNPDTSDYRKQYLHKAEEKEAVLLQAWIQTREKFRATAPDIYQRWVRFLNDTPELRPLLDIEPSMSMSLGETEKPHGGLLLMGKYYVPAEAAQLFRNILAPGLRQHKGIGGLVRGWFGLNNLMNQLNLNLSAFHAVGSTITAQASDLSLALTELAEGMPAQAAGHAIQGVLPGVPAIDYLLRGHKMIREWNKPGTSGAAYSALVKAAVQGGARTQLDSAFQTRGVANFLKALRQIRSVEGAAKLNPAFKALVKAPGAAIDAIAAPIMKVFVPRLKMGSFAQHAARNLRILPPDATKEQVREAMAKAWDSTDNRYGQIVYDNTFWDPVLRDIAMGSVRSVGWNLGDFRELGNAVADTIKQGKKAATGQRPTITDPMAFAVMYPLLIGAMGAMIMYMMTGKKPKEFKDYYFPQTGDFDENGKPVRLSMPTYMKDVYGMSKEPVKTITHKAAPLLTAAAQLLENKDYYGTKIHNEDDPWMTRRMDDLKFLGKQAMPFSVASYQKMSDQGVGTAKKLASFGGFNEASPRVNDTPAEELLRKLTDEQKPVGSRTQAESDKSRLRADLANGIRKDREKGLESLRQAVREGKMPPADMKDIVNRAAQSDFLHRFTHADLPIAQRVYEVASKQEQEQLRPLLLRKIRDAKELSPQDRKAAFERLRPAKAAG